MLKTFWIVLAFVLASSMTKETLAIQSVFARNETRAQRRVAWSVDAVFRIWFYSNRHDDKRTDLPSISIASIRPLTVIISPLFQSSACLSRSEPRGIRHSASGNTFPPKPTIVSSLLT